MWRYLPTLALVAGLLAGCTTMQPEDFSGTGPELRIEEYFEGRTRAWGIVQNRSGKPLGLLYDGGPRSPAAHGMPF